MTEEVYNPDTAPWFKGGNDLKTGVFNVKKLKALRERKGITVDELAKWAKILPSEYTEIENLVRPPNQQTAELLVIGVTGKKEI